jgi:hypothetical protein
MKYIIILLITLTCSQVSIADFRVGLECDNCTDTQYRALARDQLSQGNFGTVFIFDFKRNSLIKYHVEVLNDFNGRIIVKQLSTSSLENDIFNEMNSLVESLGWEDLGIIGPGSAYDYIGCTACETNLGLFVINNETWSLMWRETLNQATEVFNIDTGKIDFSFDYKVVVTFPDGTTVTLEMVNEQLRAIQDSYEDSDHNSIPHNSGDLDGTYLFGEGESGSNFENFIDRLESWNINYLSNGLQGAMSCSFSCQGQVCTLECKRI